MKKLGLRLMQAFALFAGAALMVLLFGALESQVRHGLAAPAVRSLLGVGEIAADDWKANFDYLDLVNGCSAFLTVLILLMALGIVGWLIALLSERRARG